MYKIDEKNNLDLDLAILSALLKGKVSVKCLPQIFNGMEQIDKTGVDQFRLLPAQGACNIDSTNDCGCRIDSLGQGASQMDQLKLALTWNRVDVAEEKIFTPDTDWPVSKNEMHTPYNKHHKVSSLIKGQ